ncbi:MAG TPA: hypothetical protein VKR60_09990 [Candidatus Sulfotelmatobacter sp.]|nr:hypothetical protein [Candidatus Sulfotelmatobacter sp.]
MDGASGDLSTTIELPGIEAKNVPRGTFVAALVENSLAATAPKPFHMKHFDIFAEPKSSHGSKHESTNLSLLPLCLQPCRHLIAMLAL